ncbi:MAG: HAD-IB family phosphatase [Thermoplasmata archaeon]
MLKLVVFDMDGVLVNTKSSWYYLHSYFGSDNFENIRLYNQHQIDYLEFMKKDISLWFRNKEKINIETIRKILDTVPIMNGVDEVFKYLRNKNIQTAIITSGLDILANRLKDKYNINYIFANALETDKNYELTGNGIMRVEPRQKGKVLKKLMDTLSLNKTEVAAVGDGEIDISMFKLTDISIAFDPINDNVSKEAKIVVAEKDLSKILPFLKL